MSEANRFKHNIGKIAGGVLNEQTPALVMPATLTSLSPLTFKVDDKIEIKESFLQVPKYQVFTEADIGKSFIFLRNHEGQVFYFLYEPSSPQGTNGQAYDFKGELVEGELKGIVDGTSQTVTITHGTFKDMKHERKK